MQFVGFHVVCFNAAKCDVVGPLSDRTNKRRRVELAGSMSFGGVQYEVLNDDWFAGTPQDHVALLCCGRVPFKGK